MSRLDFAPKIDDIKITDIKQGLGNFTPRAEKAVSFEILRDTLKKAGYRLASAEITVSGTLARDDAGLWLIAGSSQQRFAIEGESASRALAGAAPGAHVEVIGDWKTAGENGAKHEAIRPRSGKAAAMSKEVKGSRFARASFKFSTGDTDSGLNPSLTPIRTTSPGLTVYKGGAITPRFSYTRQNLGPLKVNRQSLRLSLTYTPTPTLQLETDISYQRSSFNDGTHFGSGQGFGNVTLWGKYRFFRKLETWRDRQAAIRFGVELPTGKKDAATQEKLPAVDFVRQQLTPIAGGLSGHIDSSYSQAKGRFVYGANLEGILRSERAGFRLGNEVRLNTDLEYVLLPLKYRSPAHELFLIFETTYVRRGRGHSGGVAVAGSSSSEFYVAPALQFTASSRLLIEASLQVPVVLNAGPNVLRTDRNLLVGIRYLY